MARALRAYWTAARKDEKKTGASWAIPSTARSHMDEINGKRYAILRTGDEVLAVYRLRNDGVFKALKRWPREL